MVVTVSQSAIAVPPTLKVTVPGMEAVAVMVSIAPYVGVDALNAIEIVGVACVIESREVELVVMV